MSASDLQNATRRNFSLLTVEVASGFTVVRLGQHDSNDQTNRLTRKRVAELTSVVEQEASREPPPNLIITGNQKFFSAGADLNEVAALAQAQARSFAAVGQQLMDAVDHFPGKMIAAISGYCMGGGLDLALACDLRIAAPHSVFGHRGAALGIITGWGGTQRLPRLVGRARALQMFLTAEKLNAAGALRIGLVDRVTDNPLESAKRIALVRSAPVS